MFQSCFAGTLSDSQKHVTDSGHQRHTPSKDKLIPREKTGRCREQKPADQSTCLPGVGKEIIDFHRDGCGAPG